MVEAAVQMKSIEEADRPYNSFAFSQRAASYIWCYCNKKKIVNARGRSGFSSGSTRLFFVLPLLEKIHSLSSCVCGIVYASFFAASLVNSWGF